MKRIGITSTLILACILLSGCQTIPATVERSMLRAPAALDTIVVEYKGASMMRSMGRGGFLIYQPGFPYNALEKGDIVIYWYESKTTNVAHELVMLRGQSWITAGDSNRMADIDLLTRDNYRGKVLKYFQYRGVR